MDSGTVMIVVVVLALPIAAIGFALAGPAWRNLGKGPFAIEQELPPRGGGAAPISREARDAEVRQMVEAKSYRRVARGQKPLDVDAEVARLVGRGAGGVTADQELHDEVRQLVIASNERRQRRGEAPLEVEEEVDRQLRDLMG